MKSQKAKELLTKKLLLIRKMLKNERRANQILNNKIGGLKAEMTGKDDAVTRLL